MFVLGECGGGSVFSQRFGLRRGAIVVRGGWGILDVADLAGEEERGSAMHFQLLAVDSAFEVGGEAISTCWLPFISPSNVPAIRTSRASKVPFTWADSATTSRCPTIARPRNVPSIRRLPGISKVPSTWALSPIIDRE